MAEFVRPQAGVLIRRLAEPRRVIQVVSGPRQAGKTTLVRQVVLAIGIPCRYASADEPTLRERGWIAEQWEAARHEAGRRGALLVLDEKRPVLSSPKGPFALSLSKGDGPGHFVRRSYR